MGVHAYCVVPEGRRPAAAQSGVGGAPVRAIAADRIGLWVSDLDRRPVADTATIRAHNDVIEAAMDRAVTPVPARFGQWFEDDSAAVERLRGDEARWVEHLDRFAGRAEWGVRAVTVDEPEAVREMHGPTPGTAYMERLASREAAAAAQREQAAELAGRIAERAAGTIVETHHEVSRGAISIAHLLAWNDAPAYHSALEIVRNEYPHFRFLFTGPWPPYTFVR
jgi:hypothetical protein